jgi:conjugative transfer region protein (TIGR03750 family)
MSSRDDILADRLNVEPAIFKGCSSSELGIIVGVAALVWLPVSLLLAGLMGAVTMGFGLAGVGVVGTVIVMASVFQRLKRGRPDGYYQQQVTIWLSDHGLRRAPFIRRSGPWDIGRTRYATLPRRDR